MASKSTVEEQKEALGGEREAVFVVLKDSARRLRQCIAVFEHPEFMGAFTMAYMHGYLYSGATVALGDLKECLAAIEATLAQGEEAAHGLEL